MSRNTNPALSLFSRLAIAVTLLLSLVTSSAFAQDAAAKKSSDQAGSIRGAISTIHDNVLSGVAGISVKLSGGPLHGAPLTADTDEHGAYQFLNLEPGAYSISITLQGFKTITKPVALGPKQQVVQDFTLELEVIAEKVEVKETAASIATETA